jgi:hypothetical protein
MAKHLQLALIRLMLFKRTLAAFALSNSGMVSSEGAMVTRQLVMLQKT